MLTVQLLSRQQRVLKSDSTVSTPMSEGARKSTRKPKAFLSDVTNVTRPPAASRQAGPAPATPPSLPAELPASLPGLSLPRRGPVDSREAMELSEDDLALQLKNCKEALDWWDQEHQSKNRGTSWNEGRTPSKLFMVKT